MLIHAIEIPGDSPLQHGKTLNHILYVFGGFTRTTRLFSSDDFGEVVVVQTKTLAKSPERFSYPSMSPFFHISTKVLTYIPSILPSTVRKAVHSGCIRPFG